MKNEKKADSETAIDYNFTAIPTNFIYLMDVYCFKLFAILEQKHSYWHSRNKLHNGYFIKSITELSAELGLKNRKDVRCTIEALYRACIIDIIVSEGKTDTAQFKINWKTVKELSELSLYDCIEFNNKIEKVTRTDTITYIGTKLGTRLGTNCTTTTDNTENKNNTDNSTVTVTVQNSDLMDWL